MINKFNITILFFLIYSFCLKAYASEQFNFDITELKILENGNKFIGTDRGKITTNNGILIEADKFEYNKDQNLLTANGNIKIQDNTKNYLIFTDEIIYHKNDELIYTKKNSKAISLNDKMQIIADNFLYNRNKNIINAQDKVILEDKVEDYKIYSEFMSYEMISEKIYTKGETTGVINSRYSFVTADIIFLRKKLEISSKKKISIKDKSSLYNLTNFKYTINKKELKGEDITIISNYNLPKSDKLYFDSAIIDLENHNFIAKNTEIKIHKDIFDNSSNDPRLNGVSSKKVGNITQINKGIFTSCSKNESCPPWTIQADQIIHDKTRRNLTYNNAILKVYDIPIFYFPKFFHPDPTVKRQSGFLQPKINKSNIIGNTINIPYYKVISENKDFTFSPIITDSGTTFLQGEYRQENKDSSLIADIGFVNNFKSSYSNKSKNIMHLFAQSDIDLNLENYNQAELKFYLEKTNKDTYLKIFDNHLIKNKVKPLDQNILSSGIDLNLNNDKFNLDTGFTAYEDLNEIQSDRYQFILPYFNFDTSFNNNLGTINVFSNGNNTLQNTNNLRTRIINDINFSSNEIIIPNTGFKSNFNLYFKNVNTTAKEDTIYKSSAQSELMNIFELNTSYPAIKKNGNKTELLIPKISLRVNPGDMKNHSSSDRTINANNIFSIDRLGLDDSLESGKSLTLGLDYSNKDTNNSDIFNAKIATVLRDNNENTIPSKTTLNKKNSYLFGSVNFLKNEFIDIKYNFASENNLDNIKYHDLGFNLSLNNFVTNFNFIQENELLGDSHFIENKTTFNIDENNFFSFKTRKNKEINLTEYYDLIYEYKNDCLIAGLKFKKTYYQDRDLQPSEDVFFYLTLIPLTTIEQGVN